MAINQNINPYLFGNVVLDNRPYLNFYQQQLAQRQAKESALDNYFRDLGKNITPSGMRNQDVEGLTKRTNEWRQFYAQNKEDINNPRRDGGKAYTEYMSRYQDQLGYIDRSKNRLKTTDELGKLKLDPNRSYMLDDPTLIDKMHAHDLPLDDPSGKDLNLMEMATPPKPWGIKDQAAHSAYLTHQLDVDKIPGQTQNLGGFKTMTPITHQFSNENLKVIGERSGNAYDMDRSLQFETAKLAKQVENDPARHDQLNSTFYRLYGRDMQTPRDMRIAQDILNENKKSLEYKEGKDEYGMRLALENVRFGHERQLKKEEQKIANDWVVNYYKERFAEAKAGQPTQFQDPNHPLTAKYGYEMAIDPMVAKAFERDGHQPEAFYATMDNKIMPVYYEYGPPKDKDGKIIAGREKEVVVQTDDNGNPKIDKDYSKPISLDQAYLALGYRGQTKKELGGTMQGVYQGGQTNTKPSGSRKYTIDGKSYTHDQLRKSYSEEKIKEYLDAGIIK